MAEIQLKAPLKCSLCGFEKEYIVKAFPYKEHPNAFAVKFVCSNCHIPTTLFVTQEYVKTYLHEKKA